MQAVVFAAGEGTRMRPLTDDRPKGLVAVAGKPILTRCFESLAGVGVREIVVVVGYRAGDIVERYGESFDGIPLRYAYQHERTGLADALLAAADHLDGDFLAVNGDNVFDANLGAVVERHRETDADATLLVETVSRDRATAGAVLAFDADGRVAGVVEKPDDPPSRQVPRGVRVFSPRVKAACRGVGPGHTGEAELSSAVDRVIRHGGTVEVVRLDGWCLNVNEPDDVRRAERLLADG